VADPGEQRRHRDDRRRRGALFEDDRGGLGRGRLDLFADGLGAAPAPPGQSQVDGAVLVDAEQFDAGTVDCRRDPCLDAVRVQPVHEQQAGHEVVGGEGVEDLAGQLPALVQDLHHPLEAGAVQVDDQPDEFLGAFAGGRPARRAGCDERVDPITGGSPVFFRHV
jgi:hypothetical protein